MTAFHTKHMRAVIPAAGFGTRLLPATKSMPKEMLPVLAKPVIQYVVEEAAAAGIEDILIVTGRNKRAIEDHFDEAPELEAFLAAKGQTSSVDALRSTTRLGRLFYVRQSQPKGLGHAVLQAAPITGDQPFAVLLGDDIIVGAKPATQQLLDVFRRKGRSVFCVQRVPEADVSKYGIVETEPLGDGLHRVVDIVEKPPRHEAKSNLATIGRYVFTPTLMPLLADTKPGLNGEIQLTDAMRELLRHEDVYCLEFEGVRHDVGNLEGWLEATLSLAAADATLAPRLQAILKAIGSPQVLAPGAGRRE